MGKLVVNIYGTWWAVQMRSALVRSPKEVSMLDAGCNDIEYSMWRLVDVVLREVAGLAACSAALVEAPGTGLPLVHGNATDDRLAFDTCACAKWPATWP